MSDDDDEKSVKKHRKLDWVRNENDYHEGVN